ncbi:MAG: hypothetical protein ACI4PU_06085 [Intestinibacter sp.]
MTLADMKQKIYSMIEEYSEDEDNLTEDEDLASKMNTVINQVQNELARYKKIDAYTTMEVTEGQEISLTDIDSSIYQLNVIKGVDSDVIGNKVIFNEEGTAKIYYYKYPKQIDADTEDEFVFDLSTDVLEILPYGVAGDLLKSDVSSQYGTIYSNRYKELIQSLDPRNAIGSMHYSGGVDI